MFIKNCPKPLYCRSFSSKTVQNHCTVGHFHQKSSKTIVLSVIFMKKRPKNIEKCCTVINFKQKQPKTSYCHPKSAKIGQNHCTVGHFQRFRRLREWILLYIYIYNFEASAVKNYRKPVYIRTFQTHIFKISIYIYIYIYIKNSHLGTRGRRGNSRNSRELAKLVKLFTILVHSPWFRPSVTPRRGSGLQEYLTPSNHTHTHTQFGRLGPRAP